MREEQRDWIHASIQYFTPQLMAFKDLIEG